MSDFNKCGRCGTYQWLPCKCTMIGRVWDPDNGETEDDAHELWSRGDAETALKGWACDQHSQDWEMFRDDGATRDVVFRPVGGEVEIYTISMEMQPHYRVEKAEDDVVEEVEKRMASLAAG